MYYDAYYHFVKFQLKTSPIRGEMRKTNFIRGNLNQKYNLKDKMKKTIV